MAVAAPLRAGVPHAAEVFSIVEQRLARAPFSLAEQLIGYVIAARLIQRSGGRWFACVSAAELARLTGLSVRHVRRSRAALVAAGVFRALPLSAVDGGAVVLELERAAAVPSIADPISPGARLQRRN